MGKFKLDDVFIEEVLFIGISTSLKDYQLSFFVNNYFNIKFKKSTDFLGAFFSKKEDSKFSLYYYNDKDNLSEFFLLSNKYKGSFIFNTYKQADYFLIIRSNVLKDKLPDFIISLRKIKNIFLAFDINKSKLKNFNTLLSGIDYHLEMQKSNN